MRGNHISTVDLLLVRQKRQAMSKFKVKIGDETHEIDQDAIELPDGYLITTQTKLDAIVENNRNKDKKKARADADALLLDDDFFSKAATSRGIELDDELKPVSKIEPEQLAKQETSWRAQHLTPVEKERDEWKVEAEKGRRNKLMADLMAVAPQSGLKKELLAVPPGADYPPHIEYLSTLYEWDDDKGAHFFSEGGHPVMAEKPTATNPYARPEKMLELHRTKDKDKVFFSDERPASSGFEEGGTGGDKAKVVSEEDFRSGNVDLEAVAKGTQRVAVSGT